MRPYLVRLLIVLAVSVLFSAAFNELVYFFQKEDYDRAPKTITLVIPAGTAQKVAAGEKVTGIPAEMTFVRGDVLQIKNEDAASHQLGPVWVPAYATASLVLDKADNYSYSCSFQPSRILGIDVHEATTLATRLTALLVAAPTLAALLYVYSLVAMPVKRQDAAALEAVGQSIQP